MPDLPITIRALRETDRAFILDSWVNTMCYSTPALFWVPRKTVRAKYRAMIDKLIDCRPELFRVLVNETDEDQIFGWICGEPESKSWFVTHFIYIKEGFRRMGLTEHLVPLLGSMPMYLTSWTKSCEYIDQAVYKPSLFKELINGINQTSLSSTKQERDVPKQDIQQRNTAQ